MYQWYTDKLKEDLYSKCLLYMRAYKVLRWYESNEIYDKVWIACLHERYISIIFLIFKLQLYSATRHSFDFCHEYFRSMFKNFWSIFKFFQFSTNFLRIPNFLSKILLNFFKFFLPKFWLSFVGVSTRSLGRAKYESGYSVECWFAK